MRAMKRTVSVVLALVMVLGMMTMAISVSAAETNQITATSNFADSYSVDYNANAKQVTVTYTFKTALKVVNFEGTATYDSSVLQLSEATFPGFNGEATANTEEYENTIYVNASNTNGYDFTGDGVAIANLVFNIVGTGNTTVNFDINEMTATTAAGSGEANDVDVFDESAATGDQAYTATAKVTTDVPAVDAAIFLKGHSLNLEGKVGVRFYFVKPDAYKNSTIKAVLSSDFVGTVTEVPFDTTTWNNSRKAYVGSYDVGSFDLTRKVNAKIYVDGEYVCEENYSARMWVDACLAQSTNAKQIELAKALAFYGAKSQIYYNEDMGVDTNIAELANAGIDYTAPTITADDVVVNTYADPDLTDIGLGAIGNSLVLDSDTGIRAQMVIKDQSKLDNASATINGETAKYVKKSGRAVYTIGNIISYEYAKDFSILFSNGKSYTTSVNTMIKKILASSATSQNFKNLAMALYNYGNASKAYFNK